MGRVRIVRPDREVIRGRAARGDLPRQRGLADLGRPK